MNITYYGHSCFSAELSGKTILFDPFISPNEKAKHIDISTIKPDYILISHGHFDHVADAVSIARQSGAKVITNAEIHEWLNTQGIHNTHPMNVGGSFVFDFGKVKCVVAIHSSSMPDGANGGSPMGFIIESSEGNFYYAGDTALTYDMRLIGEYKKIDFALLPIGGNFTMNVDNAIIASDFIKCDKIIGVHFDTFGLIAVDHADAKQKFKECDKELTLMAIGETRNF
jgi:L-ascorbate metabolism protein UlaG (beta-lactamase superfamily)